MSFVHFIWSFQYPTAIYSKNFMDIHGYLVYIANVAATVGNL